MNVCVKNFYYGINTIFPLKNNENIAYFRFVNIISLSIIKVIHLRTRTAVFDVTSLVHRRVCVSYRYPRCGYLSLIFRHI